MVKSMHQKHKEFVRALVEIAGMIVLPKEYRWNLDSYKVDYEGYRWQLQIVDNNEKVAVTFPRHGHWKTSQFSDFLNGFKACAEFTGLKVFEDD